MPGIFQTYDYSSVILLASRQKVEIARSHGTAKLRASSDPTSAVKFLAFLARLLAPAKSFS
jgi:hypothetical protein